MTQARFSTRELKAAAKLVAASMAAALPEPAECTHTFSPAFEEKMARLTDELGDLFAESHRLEAGIREKLVGIGFKVKETEV